MKIAINALWRARTPSGICKHAAALVRCLCLRAEVECVFLLVGSWQEQYFKQAFQLSHGKLVVRPIDISNHTCARNLWYLYGLPKLATELGADIVHLTFPVPLNRRHLTIPVVTSLHDLYPYDAPANFGFPRVLGHRLLLRQCLERSDRVACVSDFTLNRLAVLLGTTVAAKSSRIYNCVEPSHISERRPQLRNLDRGSFLLCVAQHRRNKNIDLVLQGFAAMLAEGVLSKETLLIVVGSTGPETPAIVRAISKLGLQTNIILAHGLTDAELAWLYKNTLLSLCTSTIEGFGLPLAESMQYHARVVCSDIPSFREIGGESCTYFRLSGSNLVQNFVRACECALQQPSRPMVYAPLFCADTIAAQYMGLYSDLLQARLAQAA